MSELLRVDLALRLVEERKRLGFSQNHFAYLLGTTRESIRRYETGYHYIKSDLLAIAMKLGVDAQYVLCGIRSVNMTEVLQKIGYKPAA